MRARILALIAALSLLFVPAAAQAITNGVPDDNAHPYVGELLFYVPDAQDPRFTDPGAWFTCSATMVSAQIVVTAGHCTYGVGKGGVSTTAGGGNGSGGTDIWFNPSEKPDFSMLKPSSTFAPNNNAGRYKQWSAALDASSQWYDATAYPNPKFDPAHFTLHDVGVVKLDAPHPMATYGHLPTAGLLDTLARNKRQTYTAVGYGLEQSRPHSSLGGDTRMRATLMLVSLRGAFSSGGATAKFSANNGRPHRGGTCFGDSGGPVFAGTSTTMVGVVSFSVNQTCAGSSGVYRLDQPDALAFLATFGVTP